MYIWTNPKKGFLRVLLLKNVKFQNYSISFAIVKFTNLDSVLYPLSRTFSLHMNTMMSRDFWTELFVFLCCMSLYVFIYTHIIYLEIQSFLCDLIHTFTDIRRRYTDEMENCAFCWIILHSFWLIPLSLFYYRKKKLLVLYKVLEYFWDVSRQLKNSSIFTVIFLNNSKLCEWQNIQKSEKWGYGWICELHEINWQ